MGDNTMPAPSAARDIRGDIIAKLDGNEVPVLKNFFESLNVPVVNSEAAANIIDRLQADAPGQEFLKVINGVVAILNDRYNTVQANADSLQKALTKAYAERDAWEKMANKPSGGSSAADRDGSLPHPTAFTGDEKDTLKRTSQFRTWQTRIMGRWVSRPQEFNTESKKIIYASALLEGSAAAGVFTGVQKVTTSPDNSKDWPWKTATEFMNHLARKYATIDLAANAENRLRSLSQKDEFAAFTDFLTEYTNLTDVCDWDGTARVRGFRERLSRRMRDALNMQINTPERHDFEGWVAMAQKLAINMEGEDHLRKAASNHNQNNQNRNNGGNGGKAKDPNAMDLDQMRINSAKIPEEERIRRTNNGLCFNCGKAGHQARQCRSPTSTGRGGARGGGG